MRREKKLLENDNLFIYVGAAVFVLLAISIGIIMYMTSKTGVKIENGQTSQEQQVQESTEPVTTEIGKKVEEQQSTQNEKTKEEKNVDSSKVSSTESEKENKKEDEKKSEVVATPDEPDTSNNPNTSTESKKEIKFTKPAEGEVICEYAKDNLIYSETLKEWMTHTGIDIKADKTSVIKSAADGIIKSIVNDPRYGLTVVISHDDGYETVYSNLLTAEFVVVGEEVAQGQTIGTAGNTASFESSMESHLHFELLKDGECLDPAIYLK